jgi:predicted small secreted protein
MRKTPAAIAALAIAALTLTGCASGTTSPGSGTPASGSTGAGSAAVPTRIGVTVSRNRISPEPSVHRVHLGDRVQLTVTSDKPDQVHLHGYDKEIAIQPGTPGTIDFVANVPGIFEVETHKTNLQLLQLEVK